MWRFKDKLKASLRALHVKQINEELMFLGPAQMSLATNFVCPSVCHKKIHLRSYDFLTIYSVFRICSIKNSTFSQHMCLTLTVAPRTLRYGLRVLCEALHYQHSASGYTCSVLRRCATQLATQLVSLVSSICSASKASLWFARTLRSFVFSTKRFVIAPRARRRDLCVVCQALRPKHDA